MYVASYDSNKAPLGRIRERKHSNATHQADRAGKKKTSVKEGQVFLKIFVQRWHSPSSAGLGLLEQNTLWMV